MDDNTSIAIVVASNQQLQDPKYYIQLWKTVREFGYSRRLWREHIADMLRDYKGSILYAQGIPYKIPLVDRVFGEDVDMRWMSDFLKADSCGVKPLVTSRKYERLRLLDLYVRLNQPAPTS